MGKEIFRKVSLERLSSPEQLDQLMKVTTPAGWVSLAAIGGLLVVMLTWGLTGSIPTKVAGQGILLKTGGVFDISTMSAGTVKAIYFAADDIVKKGQIVARIDQPELLDQLKNAKAALEDLQAQQKQISLYGSEETRLELQSMEQQRANLESSIKADKERIKWVDERIVNQKQLLDEGLITRQQLLASRQELETVNEKIRNNRNQFKLLDIKTVQLEAQKKSDQTKIQNTINESERNIDLLIEDLEQMSKVISPYTGRVLNIGVDEGGLVSHGEPICKLELMGNDIKNLEAVVYFPAGSGKKVRPGMTAQISPSTVEQSEYGFMLGLVTYVSEYPSTGQSMMKSLKNEALVKELSAGGAPIMVKVDLIPAPKTPSGYKWSSSEGPTIKLQTGTLCFGNVTVSSQKPISLVIPMLKKKLLGIGDQQ